MRRLFEKGSQIVISNFLYFTPLSCVHYEFLPFSVHTKIFLYCLFSLLATHKKIYIYVFVFTLRPMNEIKAVATSKTATFIFNIEIKTVLVDIWAVFDLVFLWLHVNHNFCNKSFLNWDEKLAKNEIKIYNPKWKL